MACEESFGSKGKLTVPACSDGWYLARLRDAPGFCREGGFGPPIVCIKGNARLMPRC